MDLDPIENLERTGNSGLVYSGTDEVPGTESLADAIALDERQEENENST